MFRLNREHGTTLVLVTHDVALASRCGRRLSLSSGRLVGDERVAASARLPMKHAAPRAADAARATGAPASSRVLVVALVLAVASVGTVGFFADRVKGALTRQANLLLGADVLISGDRPLPARVRRRGGAARTRDARRCSGSTAWSSAGGGGRGRRRCSPTSRRSAPGYPLRGAITARRPGEPRAARRADGIPGARRGLARHAARGAARRAASATRSPSARRRSR